MHAVQVLRSDDDLFCEETMAMEDCAPWHHAHHAVGRPGSCGSNAINTHRLHAMDLQTTETLHRLLQLEAVQYATRNGQYIMQVQTHGMEASWRQKICRWMFETGRAFELMPDTVACAAHFMDQYLSILSVDKIMLQLLSMVCMYVASKMHEPQPISMEELELLCDHKFTRENIRTMEAQLVQVLDWKLNPPTAYTFARDIAPLLVLPSDTQFQLLLNDVIEFLQVATEEYACVRFNSSSIAVAAVQLVYQLHFPQSEAAQLHAALSSLPLNSNELVECFRLLRELCCTHVASDVAP